MLTRLNDVDVRRFDERMTWLAICFYSSQVHCHRAMLSHLVRRRPYARGLVCGRLVGKWCRVECRLRIGGGECCASVKVSSVVRCMH